MALTDYIRRYIKVSIEQVEGVGTAPILGGREFSMRVYPDPARMAARDIDPSDIANLLNAKTSTLRVAKLKAKNVIILYYPKLAFQP